MVTVTPSPLAGPLQPSSVRSTDSSPSHSHSHSHSQMSRNSSRKSNNSVNCKLDSKYTLVHKKKCGIRKRFHINEPKNKTLFYSRLKIVATEIFLSRSINTKSSFKGCCMLSISVGGRKARR